MKPRKGDTELPRIPKRPKAAKAWWSKQIEAQLPVLLDRLLNSKLYGLDGEREPPPREHGVYLFTSDTCDEYVGRTGWTERSKRAGKPGTSHFLSRLKSHLTPRHNAGTFAYRRAHREAGYPTGSRAVNCADHDFMEHFLRAIEEVRDMKFRIVRIDDDRLAAVFEIYAATVLNTPWNSFATS